VRALTASALALPGLARTAVADSPPAEPHSDYRYSRYAEDALRSWKERVTAQTWGEAFVFFKHEEAGTGPKLAARFMEI